MDTHLHQGSSQLGALPSISQQKALNTTPQYAEAAPKPVDLITSIDAPSGIDYKEAELLIDKIIAQLEGVLVLYRRSKVKTAVALVTGLTSSNNPSDKADS